jgi:hypothetical protein
MTLDNLVKYFLYVSKGFLQWLIYYNMYDQYCPLATIIVMATSHTKAILEPIPKRPVYKIYLRMDNGDYNLHAYYINPSFMFVSLYAYLVALADV